MLVDSHCHLDFKDFEGELDDIVARAGAADVGTLVTISTQRSTFERVLAVAERFDNMYCTVGIHPHEADAEGETPTEELVKLAEHPKVIGIGETGLDYYYDHSDREKQRQSFRRHIAASRETGLPLVVHTRDAEDDTIAILRDEWEKGAFPGLIHCFTSTKELAHAALALGMSISVSGIVTFKSAQDLRDTIATVPLERLLVETDAPYLAPVPKRGKRNEPSFVRHTAEFLAELKGIPFEALAEATTDNFFSLFSKAERPG
ncbi:MAG: TatD family deoxyribonuclease [Alphaproteobacteria bacterium]|nr:MAG: TatD family deoxyribonuclease [Alphaproteobacteria bacterium]